jgi:hypothetical protein
LLFVVDGAVPVAMATSTSHLTLSGFLKEADMFHLLPLFVKDELNPVGLPELQALGSANRPLLLARLKELGVSKLGERQQFASALSRAEKAGTVAAPVPTPHLIPVVYTEADETITVRLKIDPSVLSHQLKFHVDANSLSLELLGEPTACCGKLHGLLKPKDCTWEIERSPRPEYDPLLPEAEQPKPAPDEVVVTLTKAMPSTGARRPGELPKDYWPSLFKDNLSKRHLPPAPEKKKTKQIELNKNRQPGQVGIGFTPRKFDPERGQKQEARRARKLEEERAANAPPALPAREHWASASATVVWREGSGPFYGEPDHPEGAPPLFRWVETQQTIVVRAATRPGLSAADVKLKARPTSVDVSVDGASSPWCGHLVGRVEPAKCRLEVVDVAAAGGADGSALEGLELAAPTGARAAVLQLTLHKADGGRWGAPWPELRAQAEHRERLSKTQRPRRDELMLKGWDQSQEADRWVVTLKLKAGHVPWDDVRLAVAGGEQPALSLYLAGQEDEPLLAGFTVGALDAKSSSWRARHAKPIGTLQVDELSLTLVKKEGGSQWRDLIKTNLQ